MKSTEESIGFFFHISSFVRELFPWMNLCDLTAELEAYPSGLLRSVSMYYLEAYVVNNGFDGLFFNRLGCLASGAIEFYLRIESPARARIIRSAVTLCKETDPSLAAANRLELSSYAEASGFSTIVSAMKPKMSRYEELDQAYYGESDSLPGRDRFKSITPIGTIDWYAERHPEDFPDYLIARRMK